MAKQRTVPGLAGVQWDERGWRLGADTGCFLCGEPVGAVAIYWHGCNLVGDRGVCAGPGEIALHSRCAVHLARHLGMDAEREAREVEVA